MVKQREKEKDEKRALACFLQQIPGIGNAAQRRLLEKFNNEREIEEASDESLKALLGEKRLAGLREFFRSPPAAESYERLLEQKIKMVVFTEEEYPERLKKLRNPPCILYYKGKLPEEKRPSLAMIGARECSEYGSHMARAFAGKAALAGAVIISGMARGIDGISQQAALDAGGKTYAVLGCGADICYPASNRRLYEEILETGGILSPFLPGTKPGRTLFPERNRIVAGLSDMVLVVEARQKSGTWITVDMALEQGKNVYAIPGRLTDRLSDGCNLLLRQGAGIALSPEDLLAEFKVLKNRRSFEAEGIFESNGSECGGKAPKKQASEGEMNAPEEESRVLPYLDYYPRTADEIFRRMEEAGEKIELTQLFFYLIKLCMQEKAMQLEGSYYALHNSGKDSKITSL